MKPYPISATLKLKPIPHALMVLRAIKKLGYGQDAMWRGEITDKVTRIAQKSTIDPMNTPV